MIKKEYFAKKNSFEFIYFSFITTELSAYPLRHPDILRYAGKLKSMVDIYLSPFKKENALKPTTNIHAR